MVIGRRTKKGGRDTDRDSVHLKTVDRSGKEKNEIEKHKGKRAAVCSIAPLEPKMHLEGGKGILDEASILALAFVPAQGVSERRAKNAPTS